MATAARAAVGGYLSYCLAALTGGEQDFIGSYFLKPVLSFFSSGLCRLELFLQLGELIIALGDVCLC